MQNKDLQSIRLEINKIDDYILELLEQRGKAVLEVARIKNQQNKDNQNNIFYYPERELEVVQRLQKNNESCFSDEHIANIFKEIMSASLAVQKPISVSYLGPIGTYSQMAVFKIFGKSIKEVACSGIDKICANTEAKITDYGVVPIENSYEGIVNATSDLLANSNLQVINEIEFPVNHCLLSNATSFDKIKHVYAHSQALAQCQKWLAKNIPNTILEVAPSNAAAVEIVKNKNDAAAIASFEASQIYSINILAEKINDAKNNSTKFWVLAPKGITYNSPTGFDKTAIIANVSAKAGSLIQILNCFSNNNINLTRLISRPNKLKNWEYIFLIDAEGHSEDADLKQALEEAQEHCQLRVLGSFPMADKR